MKSNETAREWLQTNGYDDVARMIDEIILEWKAKGVGTRRNWWRVLAGDQRGNPRKVAGRTFPIIAAIRKRQDLPETEKAKANARRERAPGIRSTGRWTV
jgi:hypothetical protein